MEKAHGWNGGRKMSRRPATFTKSDLKRAMAVACETGPEYAVRVTRDGALEIYRKAMENDAVTYAGEIRL